MKLDFSYYVSIFLRRSHYFVVICVLCAVLGVTVAMVLPSQYQAQATMVVQSPQIPTNLAATTVPNDANAQLQIIQQQLMTRANLIDLANRFKIFSKRPEMTADDIVNAMRARTTLSVSSKGGTRTSHGATLLTVSFTGDTASQSAAVTNEFVTMILQENVRLRTGMAEGTLDFFKDEVSRLSNELDSQSAKILKYKTEHSASLPENRQTLQSREGDINQQITKNTQQIDDLTTQKNNAIAMFNATGAVGNYSGAGLSPEQQALQKARNDLASAKLIYSDRNPKVTILQRRVSELEKQVSASSGSASGGAADAGPRGVLDAQVADFDKRIADLQDQTKKLQDAKDKIDATLNEIPVTSAAIDTLQRDYDSLQTQYTQANQSLASAATGERIELGAKGQRIEVVEQATVPNAPSKPNRLMITAGGLGAGVSLGLGFIVLLELLNRSIRRPVELTDKLSITPFAVLPYISTDREKNTRRRKVLLSLVAVVICIPIALILVQNFFMPLDQIIEKVLNKMGFSLTF